MADTEAIATLAEGLVRELIERGRTVATAESCTGGWIAKALTDISGSSQCFGYGIVSYSNEAKQALLDVRGDSLAADGAVSEPVVRQMATGVLGLSGADLGVAVSGVAGPDGGTAEKPVGTVWFAWATAGSDLVAECCHFDGDRESVRSQTVCYALQGLRAELHKLG
jgi:nicotinamide-nucleotide amidase